LGGGRSDVDVVPPDPPVVRIRPAEAGVGVPERAVGVVDREVRALLGEHRVLEGDDAADEVVAVPVHEPRDLLCLVKRARRYRAPNPNLPAAPLPPALAITGARILLIHRKDPQA